jgi:hypothetical protein
MRAALLLVPTAACWLGLLLVVGNARGRFRDAAVRDLCLAAGALAVSITVETFAAAIDGAAGVPNLARMAGNCATLVAATGGQLYLVHVTHPPAVARRRSRLRYAVLGATLAAMVAIFAFTPSDPSTSAADPRSGQVTYGSPLTLLYVGYLGAALVEITRLSWRYAPLTDLASLRLGLRVTATGAALGVAYTALKAMFLLAHDVGWDLGRWETPVLAPLFAVAALLIVAGATLPAWGRALGAIRRGAGRHRSYRRLHPMWAMLHAAFPETALVAAPSWLAERLDVRELRFRLYRRVIEIRDCQLALRAHADPAAAGLAHELGLRADLSGDALRAMVEAASLAAACASMRQGHRPAGSGRTTPASQETPGGGDPAAEIAWLEQVAAALRSPVVEAVVARVERRAPAGAAAGAGAGLPPTGR